MKKMHEIDMIRIWIKINSISSIKNAFESIFSNKVLLTYLGIDFLYYTIKNFIV